MKEIKNILICGIGAVGSIYANKINEYDNQSLKILVDKNRLESYTKKPKIFNGKPLQLNYILPETKDYKADLIIIATKFDGLNDVINNINNFVKNDTIIISLLNGVTSEEIIAKNYFDKIGLDYQTPNDMWRALWLKYMLNVSSNQPSAILGMTFGQMQSNKHFMNMLVKIMQEVQSIAKAEGVQNTQTMIEEALTVFNKMLPDGKTSMLQDVQAKRKTEIEMFAGTMITLGKKHNIPTPYNQILKDFIEIMHESFENSAD